MVKSQRENGWFILNTIVPVVVYGFIVPFASPLSRPEHLALTRYSNEWYQYINSSIAIAVMTHIGVYWTLCLIRFIVSLCLRWRDRDFALELAKEKVNGETKIRTQQTT